MKIAIVVGRFNEIVTQRLLEGTLERLKELQVGPESIDIAWVPGAVELPLIAQQYAKRNQYHAIICLGVVIRGETDHYDYVCQQASSGCQQVALQHNIPVIFGVLTTHNREQALARSGGAHSHKGRDCADAAVDMIKLIQKLQPVTAH